MTIQDELKRRILLKKQGIGILRGDVQTLQEQLFFHRALYRREKAMSGPYTERLSREVDALRFLVESERGHDTRI